MARPRPSPGTGSGDPSALRRRWSEQREAHLRQTTAFSFLQPTRTRRSVTKVPAPLRFAQHLPASRTVRILLALAAPLYAALRAGQGSDLTTAVITTAVLVALVFVASTLRLTVGNHGISFDVSGFRRASSFGFVPLFAVRQAELGAAPQDWPRAVLKGGWWPGRQGVSVLYFDENAAPRAFRVWVSDPDAFGRALLGRPLADDRS